MRDKMSHAVVGTIMGFVLSRAGFSSWDEVHAMFTLTDLRLVLGFGMAVVLLAIAWVVIARTTNVRWAPRHLHPGTIPGGLLFGAGWAICGACPSIALVQIGEGQLGALVTLAGMFVGNFLYAVAHERRFRWSQASCVDM
ncbi:hypothetical protein HRbin30_03146 [bacterium HR30]|nr:hypothetical protein HRbin30_03146 [bacterium HR30]